MNYYKRENYLSQIRGFYYDTSIIKVITGVRRCGKSSLMHIVAEELTESGVNSENIIFIDLDKRGYKNIKKPEQLEEIIEKLSTATGVKYLFIDEVQNVKDFEEVLNAYRLEEDYSIFITGSNSYLLSGELVTKLTGRYVEFEMLPLTFEEYLGMKEFLKKPIEDLTTELDKYIHEGGFPQALTYDSIEDKRKYVASVVQEIFDKDIKKRVTIRNVSGFQKVQQYLINNFGATTSTSNLLDELHKIGIRIKRDTLVRYIEILKDSKILYECKRFDLKSKKSIGGEQKYYLSDLGFWFVMNTDNRINYGSILENVVYNYALSKRYSISIGRIGKLECDFILRDNTMNYSYVQVAMTILNDIKTEDREYTPLEMIKDNYPKYVMTRNDMLQQRNGIKHVNIPSFMKDGLMFD